VSIHSQTRELAARLTCFATCFAMVINVTLCALKFCIASHFVWLRLAQMPTPLRSACGVRAQTKQRKGEGEGASGRGA